VSPFFVVCMALLFAIRTTPVQRRRPGAVYHLQNDRNQRTSDNEDCDLSRQKGSLKHQMRQLV